MLDRVRINEITLHLGHSSDEDVEQEVVDVVMDRLPELHSKYTHRYMEKVHKLVTLNTYILAEQVTFTIIIYSCTFWVIIVSSQLVNFSKILNYA